MQDKVRFLTIKYLSHTEERSQRETGMDLLKNHHVQRPVIRATHSIIK